jgi:hypothetical protein
MASSVSNRILSRISALILGPYFPGKRTSSPHYAPIGPQEIPSWPITPRLVALIAEHSDLDKAISALLETGSCDDLLITRLKKRKLQIKDEIACIAPAIKVDRRGATQQETLSCVA